LTSPPLTVVRHRLDDLAKCAVDMLNTRLNSTERLRRREKRLPSELVIRPSIAPVRG
jgi:LacI family transcriptional regulator